MVKFYPGEIFKELRFEGKRSKRYAISNFGRLVSFNEKLEDGEFLKGGNIDGFKSHTYTIKNGDTKIRKTKFYHRFVAENFVERKSLNHKFVAHLDHNKLNDHWTNLQWMTQEELSAHAKTSPRVIESRRRVTDLSFKSKGHKLTATKVMYIKKLLADPNRKTRLKILAKRFGVSEMTLHRIRTGENWSHVKID